MVIIRHTQGKPGLTFFTIFITLKITMGRPKKDARLLMTIPLRIMLTADQRKLIERAAKSAGADMTAWARPVLLEAARRELAKRDGERSDQK